MIHPCGEKPEINDQNNTCETFEVEITDVSHVRQEEQAENTSLCASSILNTFVWVCCAEAVDRVLQDVGRGETALGKTSNQKRNEAFVFTGTD